MQQIRAQEQIQYASLGWRFAAVAIDTLVLFGLLIIAIMVYIVVLSAQGKLDPNDAEAVQALSADIQRSTWISNVLVFGGLFVYYVVLEAIFGASIGNRLTVPVNFKPLFGKSAKVPLLIFRRQRWPLLKMSPRAQAYPSPPSHMYSITPVGLAKMQPKKCLRRWQNSTTRPTR